MWHTKNDNVMGQSNLNLNNNNNKFHKYHRNKKSKSNSNLNLNLNLNLHSIVKYRTLCFNILNFKSCAYGNKCLYAHSLETQQVDNGKKLVLELLKLDNLDEIDLIKNKELYANLSILTKLCNECINGSCPGGYNCKYGACNKNILICNIDMQTGNCKNSIENGKCINGTHLTLKHLLPYETQQFNEDIHNSNKTIRSNRILQPYYDPPTQYNTQ
jgi:hypothetical protein